MTTRIRKRGPVDPKPRRMAPNGRPVSVNTKTPEPKSASERKADERERNRAEGYVLKQIWVKPRDWERIKKYLARL